MAQQSSERSGQGGTEPAAFGEDIDLFLLCITVVHGFRQHAALCSDHEARAHGLRFRRAIVASLDIQIPYRHHAALAVTTRQATEAMAAALQRRGSLSLRLMAALAGWDGHYLLAHALQVLPHTVWQ